jgi:hypothetical protein
LLLVFQLVLVVPHHLSIQAIQIVQGFLDFQVVQEDLLDLSLQAFLLVQANHQVHVYQGHLKFKTVSDTISY